MWTDAHCHITAEVLDDARAAGVTRLITVGTDLASSRAAIALASAHDGVWATAGVHPHDAKDGIDGIEELLGDVVAVGECGLDYHYEHSPRGVQREIFAAQIGLAHEHDLALVIHAREAWDDTFAVLASEGVPDRTVFHCFTGGPDEAERCLALGAALSFSGIVTFKTAGEVREAAVLCPLDRMMVETDSPYLAPVPHRGARNQPAWVPLVGAAVAETKGLPIEEVARATTATAERIFRLRSGYERP
jgi:TatD DNase family protein